MNENIFLDQANAANYTSTDTLVTPPVDQNSNEDNLELQLFGEFLESNDSSVTFPVDQSQNEDNLEPHQSGEFLESFGFNDNNSDVDGIVYVSLLGKTASESELKSSEVPDLIEIDKFFESLLKPENKKGYSIQTVLVTKTVLNTSNKVFSLKEALKKINFDKKNGNLTILDEILAKNVANLIMQAYLFSEIEGKKLAELILINCFSTLKEEKGQLKWVYKDDYSVSNDLVSYIDISSEKHAKLSIEIISKNVKNELARILLPIKKPNFVDEIKQHFENVKVYMAGLSSLPGRAPIPRMNLRQTQVLPGRGLSAQLPHHSRSMSRSISSIDATHYSKNNVELATFLAKLDIQKRISDITPVLQAVNSSQASLVNLQHPSFITDVLNLIKFVGQQAQNVEKMSLSTISQKYSDMLEKSKILCRFSNCDQSVQALEVKVRQIVSDSTIYSLSEFCGLVQQYETLHNLRRIFMSQAFSMAVTKVEAEFLNNPLAQKKIDSFKLIHEQAKASEIDHIAVTIFRFIISPSQLSLATRNPYDSHLAIASFSSANKSRTSAKAIRRKFFYNDTMVLKEHFIKILISSLSHDEFLTIMYRYHGETEAKKIILQYIYAGFYFCERNINQYLDSKKIPPSISMPVFDLVYNIERTCLIIDTIFSPPSDKDQNDTTVSKLNDRMEMLIQQKNTLDQWVKILNSSKDYSIYQNYINNEIAKLDEKLKHYKSDINPIIKERLKSYDSYSLKNDFVLELQSILNQQSLLPNILPAEFSVFNLPVKSASKAANFEKKLKKELEKAVENSFLYDLQMRKKL